MVEVAELGAARSPARALRHPARDQRLPGARRSSARARRASSPRCTAPTSRSSAAIRSFLPITRFSIEQSDARHRRRRQYLRAAPPTTTSALPATLPIEVIPNFVDTDDLSRPRRARAGPPARASCTTRTSARSSASTTWCASSPRCAARCRAQLVLIGDGPERSRVEALVHELGLARRGALPRQAAQLRRGAAAARDVFLLPSETESFGLAALEALSCGVPVVASRVGGAARGGRDGETGVLCRRWATWRRWRDAACACSTTRALHARMSRRRARARASSASTREPMVDRYEALRRARTTRASYLLPSSRRAPSSRRRRRRSARAFSPSSCAFSASG